jgi:hypothetical protein
LVEGLVSLGAAYRADSLTRKYTQESNRAKELNPFARWLYRNFGNKTFFITSLFIIAFITIPYTLYYYIASLKILIVEIFLPIIVAIPISDWINDEFHAYNIKHRQG